MVKDAPRRVEPFSIYVNLVFEEDRSGFEVINFFSSRRNFFRSLPKNYLNVPIETRSQHMERKIGSVIPSEKEIAKLAEEVQALRQKMTKFTIDLSFKDRRQTTKFRHGGEKIVALMTQLAAQHNLRLSGVPVESMKDGLTLSERLAPLAETIEVLAKTLSDTVLQAQSECWWATTAYYSAFSRMVVGDPQLQAALRPAVEFFSLGRRKPKPAIALTAAK